MFPSVNGKRVPRHAILSDEAVRRYARTTQLGAYNLLPSELFWQERQPHLEQHGYLLRPRYSPSWRPSWTGTNLAPPLCEDSIMSNKDGVIDARKRDDMLLVAIKSVEKDSEEIHIGRFLTSLRDLRNHCIPVLDVIPDPFDPEWSLLVMPYLRPFNDPPFYTVGEVIDFIDQTLEGLAFLHRHGVAHRDISAPNIMMDARSLYPEGHHPVRRNYSCDGMHRVTPLTRTEKSVRYFYIDFGLSTRFAPGSLSYAVGKIGRDIDVPELSADVPYDAYKVDIFSLGNVYDKEFEQKYHDQNFLASLLAQMKNQDPSKRPPIEDVIAHWSRYKSEMPPAAHRWRLSLKSEQKIERAYNDAVAAAWQGLNDLKKMVA
ncbi:kinase-like domain-containing protein [Daedaleopsis nitida]|nr:kinase-like domain-containing protein [Daedaleopsis nitida]